MKWYYLLIPVAIILFLFYTGVINYFLKYYYYKSRFGSYCVNTLPSKIQHELYDVCNLSKYNLTINDIKVKTFYDGEYCHVKIYIKNTLVEYFYGKYLQGYPLYCKDIINTWLSKSK